MEKINCTDRVRNEEVFQSQGERNNLHTVKRRMTNWSHLALELFLKHVIEGKTKGKMEVTGRRGRIRKRLLDDLKEKGG
jgi:hypothetical protein